MEEVLRGAEKQDLFKLHCLDSRKMKGCKVSSRPGESGVQRMLFPQLFQGQRLQVKIVDTEENITHASVQ